MHEMFQLSLDTLLPVSRCWYESINGERWERTAVVGGWAYRTVEWKMRQRWMKRSEISLSASLNGQFHTCSEQVSNQIDWWVSSLKVEGSRASLELLLTLRPFCPFSPQFSCNFCIQKQVDADGNGAAFPIWTFLPSLRRTEASCSDYLTVLLKQVSSKQVLQALINTNSNIWNGLSVFYRHYIYTVMYFTWCRIVSIPSRRFFYTV